MVQYTGRTFPVVITGQDFRPGLDAWLGANITITVPEDGVTSTSISGTIPSDIPADVYGVTVRNPDGKSGWKSPVFTMLPRPHPTTTFGSDAAFVTTFGPNAPPSTGDDDHVQIIFFEVLDTAPDNLYIRIQDADTGGTYDEKDEITGTFDTVMTYTVRGGDGAYTHPDAQSAHPAMEGMDGIRSGQVITQRVVGDYGVLDGNVWLTLGLREGKNREVKRLLEALGLTVNRLIRVSFGPFALGELAAGEVEEVKQRVLKDQLGATLSVEFGLDQRKERRERKR